MWLLGTEPGSSEEQRAPERPSHLASPRSSSLGCVRLSPVSKVLFGAVVSGVAVCGCVGGEPAEITRISGRAPGVCGVLGTECAESRHCGQR